MLKLRILNINISSYLFDRILKNHRFRISQGSECIRVFEYVRIR